MTDKKFNYEKIAQALNEADLFLRNRAQATPTPLNTFDIAMMFSIAKTCCVSLDLINRQKAEIERLKAEIERIQKARLKQAKFLAEQKAQKYELINKLSRAKTESYKEFVERLKEKLDDCHIVSDGEYCGFDCSDIHECINTSLKEMVGEK